MADVGLRLFLPLCFFLPIMTIDGITSASRVMPAISAGRSEPAACCAANAPAAAERAPPEISGCCCVKDDEDGTAAAGRRSAEVSMRRSATTPSSGDAAARRVTLAREEKYEELSRASIAWSPRSISVARNRQTCTAHN